MLKVFLMANLDNYKNKILNCRNWICGAAAVGGDNWRNKQQSQVIQINSKYRQMAFWSELIKPPSDGILYCSEWLEFVYYVNDTESTAARFSYVLQQVALEFWASFQTPRQAQAAEPGKLTHLCLNDRHSKLNR